MNPIRFVRIGKTRVLIALLGAVAASLFMLQSPTSSVAAPPRAPKVIIPVVLPMVGSQISVIKSTVALAPPHSPSMYGVVNLSTCNDVSSLKAAWTYVYSPYPTSCSGVETVPMIQSASQMVSNAGGTSQWLLGFNEPDLSGWAQQTPQVAAVNWNQIEQWYPNRLLVSPSPAGWPSYDQLNWLHNFRTAYQANYGRAPRLDALAVHVYFTKATDAISVVNAAIQLSDAWGAQGVWVTEFGMPASTCGYQNKSDLTEESTFLSYLNSNPKVLRYSWFGSSINVQQGIQQGWYGSDWCDLSLITNGVLTPLGSVYVTAE